MKQSKKISAFKIFRKVVISVNYPNLYRLELVKAQVDYPKSFEDYVI